ncbi:MAG: hypothetical protein C5B49_14925, partial [Bdellovibrio sp.]
ITHGNSGYLTFFRNYSSSQFASPIVWNDPATQQTAAVGTMVFDGGDIGMNVVGNVLGAATAGTSVATASYDSSSTDVAGIYVLGLGGAGLGDVAATSLFRTGNYDYFNKKVMWQSGTAVTLPSSLYLSSQPTWWPPGTPWPWVGPDLSPMVGTLPAKARSDSKYSPPTP